MAPDAMKKSSGGMNKTMGPSSACSHPPPSLYSNSAVAGRRVAPEAMKKTSGGMNKTMGGSYHNLAALAEAQFSDARQV